MYGHRVESTSEILARTRRRLNKSRRPRAPECLTDPPGPLPGIAPLTPIRIARNEHSLQASLRPITQNVADLRQRVDVGFASSDQASETNAAALRALQETTRDANSLSRQGIITLAGRIDDLRASGDRQRLQLEDTNNRITASNVAALEALPHTLQNSLRPITRSLDTIQARVATGAQASQAHASAIQHLEEAFRDANSLSRRVIDTVDGLQSYVESHNASHQEDIVNVNGNITTLRDNVARFATEIHNVQASLPQQVSTEDIIASIMTTIQPTLQAQNAQYDAVGRALLRSQRELCSQIQDDCRTLSEAIAKERATDAEAMEKILRHWEAVLPDMPAYPALPSPPLSSLRPARKVSMQSELRTHQFEDSDSEQTSTSQSQRETDSLGEGEDFATQAAYEAAIEQGNTFFDQSEGQLGHYSAAM